MLDLDTATIIETQIFLHKKTYQLFEEIKAAAKEDKPRLLAELKLIRGRVNAEQRILEKQIEALY